ncbi:MAG: ABC transporter substrate-binding protein [Vulcanococcus sp.]|jgi:NitT/TauT family transport system substrate-binding protein|uniref:ABC transporter substrate-binding protein n=1 Tax=Vulcanococcus sp. TaxID=2856995 RepID=UPI0025D17397|nr:ABC transporter substrate-binding protein [Vulcanococcus sp.]MBW0174139.1 ABC transporter substrate-binding protein [Vulcanococcus sp.]MBW0181270.1 ABC transporter substrate-binding protein [Vulcanococcus sp.]
MRQPRLITALLASAGLALALGACLAPWQQRQVRLAIVDWPAYEYFYLASRKGLDLQQGYRLQVDQFGSLQDQRRAFSRGDVEAIATTLPEAIAICREAPARCPSIVLVLDDSNGADQVVAGSRWRSVAELKGQRVGLEPSVLGEFMLLRAVQGQGLKLADFKLRYDGPKALVSQLQRGVVDAIVTYSPHSDGLVADPRFRVLFSSSQIPGEVVDVLAVSPELLRRDSKQVAALVRTWWAARQLAAQEPQQATALMAQRQGVTPEQFLSSQRLIRYPDRNQQAGLLAADGPVQRTLQRLQRQMREANRIPQAIPLPKLTPGLVP